MTCKLGSLKKIDVGEFYGTDMMRLTNEGRENDIEKIQTNLFDGIGLVILVMPPDANKPIKAVLEDIDFITDPDCKRYIFSYFDEKAIRIDTLFDKGWSINYEQ